MLTSLFYDWEHSIPSSEAPDVQTLQEDLRSEGYFASMQDIHRAWEDVSESFCAGWLMVETYSREDRLSMLKVHLQGPE